MMVSEAISGLSFTIIVPHCGFTSFVDGVIRYAEGVPKTLVLNFASAVESLVRMGVQRPQTKFQRYRPYGHWTICKTNRGKWGIPGKSYKNVAKQC